MSAPGNANARLQPGVRAIKLTDAPTLRRCVRHVNGSYGEAELRTEKARRALREFAKIVTEARKVFAAPGGVGSPSTPGWPESPKSPGSPVPPVSEGHDDDKALKILGRANVCEARNTARKRLWQLARDLTALEKKANRELEIAEITVAVGEWYRLSQPFLDPAKAYDTFLAALIAALRKVRVPTGEGETIEKALDAVAKLLPSQLPGIPGYSNAPESWRRVAAVHRELSRSCRGNTYFLSCRHGAKAHSSLSYQTVSDINHTLERLGVIKLMLSVIRARMGKRQNSAISGRKMKKLHSSECERHTTPSAPISLVI